MAMAATLVRVRGRGHEPTYGQGPQTRGSLDQIPSIEFHGVLPSPESVAVEHTLRV